MTDAGLKIHPPAGSQGPIRSPSDGAACARGQTILGALDYVHHVGDAQLLTQVLSHLSAEDIAVLSGRRGRRLTALRWYPLALHCRLLWAIERALSPVDTAVLHDVGRHMAKRDVPRVFTALIRRGGDPGRLITMATKVWRFYNDRGHWDVQRGQAEVIARLYEHPEPDEAYCKVMTGWITRTLEMSGADELEVTHPLCRARGQASCTYIAHWKEADD